MGQKVHPIGIRLGVVKNWNSIWFANSKDYADSLNIDIQIRNYLYKKLQHAFISNIKIERPSNNIKITINTSRPGIVIGKKGEGVEILCQALSKKIGSSVQINIEEIKKSELDAFLVAKNICQQLEKRIAFRRAMKRAIQSTMKLGAKGIKVSISGRLNGAEIARTEWSKEGRIPLHTLRADIDYSVLEALTTYGILGVKVWIFKGEVLPKLSGADGDKTAESSSKEVKNPKKALKKGVK